MNKFIFILLIGFLLTFILSCKSGETTTNNLSIEKQSRIEQLSKENGNNNLEIKTNNNVPTKSIGKIKQPK